MALSDGPQQSRTTLPSKYLPPVEFRDLPEPVSLRKVTGASVIILATAIGSGEILLWPYITTQVGFIFMWAAVVGFGIQFFLNMEIERYTLATGETAITGFTRFWKPWWWLFVIFALLPELLARLGDRRSDGRDVRVRDGRGRAGRSDHDRGAARHRHHPHPLPRRLPGRREDPGRTGRADHALRHRRDPDRHHERSLGCALHQWRRLPGRTGGTGHRAAPRRAGVRRRRRRQQPGAEQLHPRQGHGHGHAHAQDRLPHHRARGGEARHSGTCSRPTPRTCGGGGAGGRSPTGSSSSPSSSSGVLTLVILAVLAYSTLRGRAGAGTGPRVPAAGRAGPAGDRGAVVRHRLLDHRGHRALHHQPRHPRLHQPPDRRPVQDQRAEGQPVLDREPDLRRARSGS